MRPTERGHKHMTLYEARALFTRGACVTAASSVKMSFDCRVHDRVHASYRFHVKHGRVPPVPKSTAAAATGADIRRRGERRQRREWFGTPPVPRERQPAGPGGGGSSGRESSTGFRNPGFRNHGFSKPGFSKPRVFETRGGESRGARVLGAPETGNRSSTRPGSARVPEALGPPRRRGDVVEDF